MKNPFKTFDNFFINLINKQLRNKYFDFLFYHITNLGGALSLVSLTGILVIFMRGKYRQLGFKMATTLVFSAIIVQILKRIFTRNRPYWILENLNTFGIDLRDYSFPSGHSAASFSVAVIIALNFKGLAFIAIFLAVLIALSRIYLAVHYPTDVAAGIIIGIVSSFIVQYRLYPFISMLIKNKIGG